MTSISRRHFCLGAGALALGLNQPLWATSRSSVAGRVTEWSFESGKTYDDPFHDVQLDVVFKDVNGHEQAVPAYWAGEQTWRVRYSTPQPGNYTWRTVASDRANPDLHGRGGSLQVVPYLGTNALYRHGPLRVSENRRYLTYADGTPFFWMGDTWWHCLNKRLRWPEDFQLLVADRVKKGFNVVQIVAGLSPNVPPNLDPKGANEAGLPWEANYERINPAYFDMADLRIQHLVDKGLMPCVVACWGYYLPVMGIEKMKQHWRYLVARWGAYPVVWCLAGEGTLPYRQRKNKQKDKRFQRKGWTEIARYVRKVDPYHRLVTIHPSTSSRDTVEDPAVLDFDMLQTGHNDRQSIPNTVKRVIESYETKPKMPVINAEVCYEGILGASFEDVQRFMFWACILNGACGHTYGANGVWQVNIKGSVPGTIPGSSWGTTPWQEAYRYPGSRQVGLAAGLLRRYPWWRFELHPEWVTAGDQPPQLRQQGELEQFFRPYAAGIPGQLRLIYMPRLRNPPIIKNLEQNGTYKAFLFNPLNGEEHDLGRAEPNASGDWQMPKPPVSHDWVIVLKKA